MQKQLPTLRGGWSIILDSLNQTMAARLNKQIVIGRIDRAAPRCCYDGGLIVMSNHFTFQLGPLAVRIEEDDLITPWAMRTFAVLETDSEPGLVFCFTDVPVPKDNALAVGDEHVKVASGQVTYRERRYDVRLSGCNPLEVTLSRRDRRALVWRSLSDPEETWKMWLSHGSNLNMHLLKEFAYTISPLAIMCALLVRGGALIHAGGLSIDGKGVLLPAWGGVGKSTVVSRAVMHGRAAFMADDHAVIDEHGKMYLHPLPMHIYRYHVLQDAALKAQMLDICSWTNRLQWHVASVLRPKRVVRWMHPISLFGAQKVQRQTTIEQVIVMFRGTGDTFIWETQDAAAAARTCVGVMMEEISGFADRLSLAGAGWHSSVLPSLGEVCGQLQTLYEAAFSHARCAHLLVPHNADADTLLTFLRSKCPLIAQAFEHT